MIPRASVRQFTFGRPPLYSWFQWAVISIVHWNILVVQMSLWFLFRCWVANCSFVFRGHIDQFYKLFLVCLVFKNCCDLKCRSSIFWHLVTLKNVERSLFCSFILLGLRKGFYKEGIEICLFPISLSNEFSGNVSSRSLCFNFIVHILVCTFYDCQIGFNKNFSLQRKLCRLGT